MAFWGKKKAQPPGVSCYGKLTATGDFIRHNNAGAECAAFDMWLSQSINLARESMGASFGPHYEPALGLFVYRGEDGDGSQEPERGMIGAWAASGDSAGRKYPMVVAASYDYEQLVAAGPALPVATWSFVSAAYDLVANGRQLGPQDFVARVAALQAPPLEQSEGVTSGYRNFIQNNSMRALWMSTFGTVDCRFSVVQNIHATIEIFAGQERPQTSLALRFPLHAADTYAAAVWMDLTLRLAQWKRTVLNAFWTPKHDLMLHVGPPQKATFRELITWGGDAEHVTDLVRSPASPPAAARGLLSEPWQRALDDPDRTIASFLDAIG